jgi:glycosyltransferase involved in cell wall biosynthesis
MLEVRSDFEENNNNTSENEGIWYICDLDGNPAIPAPAEFQERINQYTSNLSPTTFLPLITVITVVYNGAKYLEDTIKSVINQTYPNVEYIIIDGGSTDGTLDIIKKYEDYIDYWVSEPDKGIYDAMNKGIKVALGHGILFLNSGDKLLTNRCFNNIKIPGFLYCKYEIKLGKVRINRTIKKPKFYKISLPVPHQAIIFDARKKLLYDTSYKLAADYDYFLRHGYNDKLPFLENSLVYYDNSGVSKKMSDLRDREILEIISKNFGRKYRVFVSSFFLFKNFINIIVNTILK